MANDRLNGRRVAVLATDGFEQSELTEPKRLLEEAGATVEVIAPGDAQRIKGWNVKDWGEEVPVDVQLAKADANGYDALVLPGGVINPDKLRTDEKVLGLVKTFAEAGKPIAAICHGNRRRWTCENGVAMLPTPSSRRSIMRIVPANMHMLMTCRTNTHGITYCDSRSMMLVSRSDTYSKKLRSQAK